jgi:hypothetical protein
MKYSRGGIFLSFLLALIPNVLAFAGSATPNDVARFLAGMPVDADTGLDPLTSSPAFKKHSQFMNQAWDAFTLRQYSKVREWSANNLKDSRPTLFYMFSGPDFLYADAFFPGATTYILAGLEPAGSIPDAAKLAKASLPQELAGVRDSLNSVLSYSFFITKEMRYRLSGGRQLSGTLPLLYVFLARSGNTIGSVSFVTVDREGTLREGVEEAKADEPNSRLTKGVKISFLGRDGKLKTLYYFTTDLSDDGASKSGFLKFCDSFGTGNALLKSASYLLHSGNFTQVRDFLLQHTATILQDDSGIPLRNFNTMEWHLKPFGRYAEPIALFSQNYQRDMHRLFMKEHAVQLDFDIGYRHRSGSLLLAVRKATEEQPQAANADAHTVADATKKK